MKKSLEMYSFRSAPVDAASSKQGIPLKVEKKDTYLLGVLSDWYFKKWQQPEPMSLILSRRNFSQTEEICSLGLSVVEHRETVGNQGAKVVWTKEAQGKLNGIIFQRPTSAIKKTAN